MPPELVVVSAPPGAGIQDAGRPGRLSVGIPPSGPLDPEAHAAANLAVGNDAGAAAIEIPLGPMTVRARGPLLVSVDGASAMPLGDGQELTADACTRAVRYLAVAGGMDVPVVLGARATFAAARLGGLRGGFLVRGDVVPVAPARSGIPSFPPPFPPPRVVDPLDPAVLEVIPGPHGRRFPAGALDALLGIAWSVSARSDRVGTRLEGGRIPRAPAEGDATDLAPPVPMIRGAIQVVTDGTPIVLGPDHPVTGGYPVIAVLARASQPVLARLRPGRGLRFVISRAATGRSTRSVPRRD
jgi:biotin-dependent carboxylase-like uncharacterized protein